MSIESSTNSIMNIHSFRMHETSRASLNMGKFLLLSTSAFFVQIKTFLDFDQLNVKILRRVWKKSPKGFHSVSLPQQVFQPCNLLFFFNVQSNSSKCRIILPQKAKDSLLFSATKYDFGKTAQFSKWHAYFRKLLFFFD